MCYQCNTKSAKAKQAFIWFLDLNYFYKQYNFNKAKLGKDC